MCKGSLEANCGTYVILQVMRITFILTCVVCVHCAVLDLVRLRQGQNLDALHAYFYRLVSAMLLGQCCLNKLALHFQKEHCKRTVLMSKAMVSLCTLYLRLWCWTGHGEFVYTVSTVVVLDR